MVNGKFSTEIILSSAVRTTSGNSNAVSVSFFRELVVHLNVTANSGTLPTLDIKFQDSIDAVNWVDVPSGAFTQITTTNGLRRLILPVVGHFIRAVYTLGGASPSYTFDLQISGKN